MHNLKPNTEYQIVNVQIAVPSSLVETGEFYDGMSVTMNEAIACEYSVIGDWQYAPDRFGETKVTDDSPEEGSVFC